MIGPNDDTGGGAGPELKETACSTFWASSARKADGWAPVLEYANGGRIVAHLRFGTKEAAESEASDMVGFMRMYPEMFVKEHPKPNQLIEL